MKSTTSCVLNLKYFCQIERSVVGIIFFASKTSIDLFGSAEYYPSNNGDSGSRSNANIC